MKSAVLQDKTPKLNWILYILLTFVVIFSAASGCTGEISEELSPISEGFLEESQQKNVISEIISDQNTSPASETKTPDENYNSDSAADSAAYPHLIPKAVTGPEYSKRTFTTKFEKTEYTVTFDVNMSILAGAEKADKSLADHIASGPEDIQIKFYSSFFEGEANYVFFEEISKKLRHVKIANSLSDQKYLEYLIAFVQQIPYDFLAEDPRFPIEVLFEKTGDCDEKSMLLIGLLNKSGYDTALILFPDMGHAVAGIRIIPQGDTDFRVYKAEDGRKYLFIEATAPNYIGLYPEDYEDAEAIVIPVGSGGIAYTNYNYVAYIVDSKKKIQNRIIFFENKLNEMYYEIKALEEKLTEPQKYYAYQSEYDSDYNIYKALLEEYNEYYDMYQKNIEVYNHIISYPYDVEGVRRTIFNSKVNEMEY